MVNRKKTDFQTTADNRLFCSNNNAHSAEITP